MYSASPIFQQKVKELNRTWKISVQIQHSSGTLTLTDKDIVLSSIRFSEASQAGEEFMPGGVVSKTFDISIINKPEYANINFEGATVIPQVALFLSKNTSAESYFTNATQPSEFEEGNGEELWERIPLGVFYIDEPLKERNAINIKSVDSMIKLDKPYSLSTLSYPATLYQIYVDICNFIDVQVGTLNFPNKDITVSEKPSDNYTFRDVLKCVSELAGRFSIMNRVDALELRWYTESGLTITPMNRMYFKTKEYSVKISGVQTTIDDVTYLYGTSGYVIDFSGNFLLQAISNYGLVLQNITEAISALQFVPYESSWQGNPALEVGDIITQIDRDGNEYKTIVTHNTYKYRGQGTIFAKGLPEISRGFKGSTNKKIINIVRQELKPIGNQLTTLEQAQLNATELIANMLGGYTHFEADAFYISDNPVLANSTKIWKWGIGGFGYSDDGGVTYKTGITAEGSIVANLISAGIVTADMVQTGILQSEDGSTWINLNNGEFNFKDAIKWVNGSLVITGGGDSEPQPDDPTIVRQDTDYNGVTINAQRGIEVNFSDGGRARIGKDSILVENVDGSLTKIDGRGISMVLSIPQFTDVPTAVTIEDKFETGVITDSRLDIQRCYIRSRNSLLDGTSYNVLDYAKVLAIAKYTGNYGIQFVNPIPPVTANYNRLENNQVYYRYKYQTVSDFYFYNYTPSKDSIFSAKYKVITAPYTTAKLHIRDLTAGYDTIIDLTSTSWVTINHQMIKDHVYGFMVNITLDRDFIAVNDDPVTQFMTVHFDDFFYESNVTGSIITGYAQGTVPYNPFIYVGSVTFLTKTVTVTLPEYFKGLNFNVFLTNPGSTTATLDGINNKIPNFTASCAFAGATMKSVYIVTLNQ